MASTRIFVKGLPPGYSETEFRSYFSQRHPVTDVKLFPRRRIGYVGFKTPQDAAGAVKYFNKSFIRMSRLSVELANDTLLKSQPNGQSSLLAPTTRSNTLDSKREEANPLKRKRETHSSTRSAKEDNAGSDLQPPPRQTSRDNGLTATPLRPTESGKEPSGDGKNGEDSSVNASHVKFEANAHVDRSTTDGISPEVQDEEEPSANEPTDADWMRSRTSRLLGLVDDDEQIMNDAPSSLPHENLQSNNAEPGAQDVLTSSENEQDTATGEAPEEETQDASPDADEQTIRQSKRLFLRNLPYSATEDDLLELFTDKWSTTEVHIPLDARTGQGKGIAFVEFDKADEAVDAFHQLDNTFFQGRILHVLPGSNKIEQKLNDFDISKLPLKKQKQIQKKKTASSSTFNWNSMFMNADAVMSSISDRLGVPKSELLDPSASDAAVKQAQAETHVIQETKSYFERNGVDLDAFKNRQRGDTAILVKNFPYGTTKDELKKLFSEFGTLANILMPPSGTIAIVEFDLVTQARAAFTKLAYRKFKDSVLFLEKAPKGIFNGGKTTAATRGDGSSSKPSGKDLLEREDQENPENQSTLFVRNLNFATTNERFRQVFQPLDGYRSARIKTKPDPKRPGGVLSMGFGFLEFATSAQAQAALKAMNGYELDGHQLLMKSSHKGIDAAEQQRREDKARRNKLKDSKIIIKNLPFEASKKDVRNLFKSYGQLRAVRVPRKFDGSRKGFAFAEFTTSREAENAMDALRDTHLLGRRLVLDFAAAESHDPEEELEKMREKVEKQSSRVASQQLGGPRKKFRTDTDELNE